MADQSRSEPVDATKMRLVETIASQSCPVQQTRFHPECCSHESEKLEDQMSSEPVKSNEMQLIQAIASQERLIQPTRFDPPNRRNEICSQRPPANFAPVDHAALARSIREICLEATPELNEYPSFDEPRFDGESSLETNSSGGENKPIVANDTHVVHRGDDKSQSKRKHNNGLFRSRLATELSR
jgi:hypothetical protein